MPKFSQFLCLYFLLSGPFFAAGQTVTGVSSTASDGSYKVGDVIPITVEFSEVVNVTGTPQLTLETGNSNAVVNYSSGTGTNTLTFNYTVASDHITSDLDYVATTSLIGPAPNPGTPVYKDTNGGAQRVTVNGNYAYVGDGSSGLAIIDISDPTNPGTPIYRDTNGDTYGVAISGNYAYVGNDISGLAIIPTNPGSINDAAGNVATLTLVSPGAANSLGANKAIVVDSTVPSITNVTSTAADGSYKSGDVIPITVEFSEVVNVTGTPQLTLETGSSDAVVDYSSGTGTNTLTFNYTVASDNTTSDLDYVATSSLALNSGTINDAAGNAATLTLSSPGATNSLGANKAIVVDGTVPTITRVTSTAANGSYKVGDVIPITVEFSEVVNITGTPQLTLETGSTDAVVDYSSGTGTNIFTFNYTVASDHTTSDLDYVATSSLALNSGTINDAGGNAATLVLASPGAANSLGANKAIVVDGTVPTMSITANEGIDGFTSEDSTLSLTFASSESITDFTIADITVTGGTMSALVAVNDSTYTATFTPSGEGAKTRGVAVGAYKDVVGNQNIAAAQFNWIYDVDNAPQISDTIFSIAENSPNGTVVGTIQASDADTLSYISLTGNTDQAFDLNVSTGVLSVTDSTALDYETAPVFSLLVQASDGALSDSATVTINLIDVDEEEEEETLSLADASAMIYPNPSNGIVNIKMAALKEATIYNLSGKRIMRSTDNRIDVSTLSEGVYIIKLENKSGDRFSTRLIKE